MLILITNMVSCHIQSFDLFIFNRSALMATYQLQHYQREMINPCLYLLDLHRQVKRTRKWLQLHQLLLLQFQQNKHYGLHQKSKHIFGNNCNRSKCLFLTRNMAIGNENSNHVHCTVWKVFLCSA